MLKKALIGVGVLVVLLVGAVGAMFGPVFAGIVPSVDGTEIGEPKARLVVDGYVNVFVIPAGEKTVALIDCGNDAKGEAILKELTRRGLTADSVAAVFLTHGHPDHIAACHLFTKAKIYAFEGDVKPAAGEVRFKGPLPSKTDIPVEKRVKVTDVLTDGTPVQVDGLTVTPYAVPGHTAGSAAFLANGVLYLGDNAAAKKDGFVPAPWIFSDDTEENKRSLKALYEKLKTAGTVKTLAPAHSAPVDGLDALKHSFES